MIIELKQFGIVLTSRQAGREAFAAFQPTLSTVKSTEAVTVDFDGVSVFTPSWADEFITPLLERYKDRVSFRNTDNASVKATLAFLDKIRGGQKFF